MSTNENYTDTVPNLWKYVTDGGKFWTGTYWSHQPRTHRLVNSITGEEKEYNNKKSALKAQKVLNKSKLLEKIKERITNL